MESLKGKQLRGMATEYDKKNHTDRQNVFILTWRRKKWCWEMSPNSPALYTICIVKKGMIWCTQGFQAQSFYFKFHRDKVAHFYADQGAREIW